MSQQKGNKNMKLNKNITKHLKKIRRKIRDSYLIKVSFIFLIVTVFLIMEASSAITQENTSVIENMDTKVKQAIYECPPTLEDIDKGITSNFEGSTDIQMNEINIIEKINIFADKINGKVDLRNCDFNMDGTINRYDRIAYYKCDIDSDGDIDHEDVEMFKNLDINKNGKFDLGEDIDMDNNLDIDENIIAIRANNVWTPHGPFDMDNDGRCDSNEDRNGNGKLDSGEINSRTLATFDMDSNGVVLWNDVDVVKNAAATFALAQELDPDINGDLNVDKQDICAVKGYYRIVVKYMNLLSPETLEKLDKNKDDKINRLDLECVVNVIIKEIMKELL